MAIYEGGAVGISIYPDTTEFGFELRRKLAKYADDDLTIPLNIDVDDANWTAAKRRINNDRLSKTVEVRGDTSALRKAVQDIEERDISPKVDLTSSCATCVPCVRGSKQPTVPSRSSTVRSIRVPPSSSTTRRW